MSHETTRKILFVDDEQPILDGIRRQLHKQFEVETALGGQAGLDAIALSGPFAVVVSDLRMDDIDGLTFLRKVHQVSPDSVCIMLTGYADLDVAVSAVNEGRIFRFLSKPCESELLIETITESLEHYRRLSSIASYTYSADVVEGQIVWKERSQGCVAVTGYTHEEILSNHLLWLSMVEPEHRSISKSVMDRIISGEETGPVEFKIKKSDGTVRWVRDTTIPRRDMEEKVIGLEGLVEDITERKEIEEELKRSESRYQRMVANVPGLVYQLVLRSDGTIEFPFVSDSCAELFNIAPGGLISDASLLLNNIKNSDRCQLYRALAASAEKMKPLEWWGSVTVGSQQKLIQAVASPERLDSSDVLWDGLLMDMTEYRQIEDQARSLAKFPSENPNPVMRLNPEGTILYANKASRPLQQLWGTKMGDEAPAEIREKAGELQRTGDHDMIEIECKDQIWSIVFASTEDADYVNLYARDVTAIKKAESELIRTNTILREHDRMKSEFVTTVSHELRTPLCIFKNIVSNAMAGALGKVSKKLYQSLKMADESIDRLARIINAFLDISKIESGSLKLDNEVFAVKALVGEIVVPMEALADEKGIDLKITSCREELFVKADRDRIAQVITNLVGNAIKFVPVNGHINVIVTDEGEKIQVSVDDDGPGLSKEEMSKVFNRFVQVNKHKGEGEHGTGLGLAIAKELIDMHDGNLWLDSVLGRGCCFSFDLPKVNGDNTEAKQNKELVGAGK